MPTPFSKVYVRLRREAGFKTAYQFFHANGGQKVMGCTFSNYLRIERGSNLPQPQRLPVLCSLLRLPLRPAEQREFCAAYLETWLGSAELRDWLLAPFAQPASGSEKPPAPANQALARVIRQDARPISVGQYEAIMSSAGAYWSHRVLSSTLEPQSPAELAERLKLKPAEIASGLKTLAAQKLAARLPDGRYRSTVAGEFLVFPDSRLVAPETMEKVFRYNRAMVEKQGAQLDVRYCGVRADLWKLQGYLTELRESIRAINAYAVTEKTDRSAMVFVEARVLKLFDF